MSGKTEWEDILIEKGIMAAPVEEPDQDELWMEEQDRLQQEKEADPYKHLYGKSLDELREHEDELESDAMAMLRKRRLDELKKQAARNKFGRVVKIGEPEWKNEVTECEKDVWVVVNLFSFGNQESRLIDGLHEELARKFKDVKFVAIEGRQAIRNYPDSMCPTLLVYLAGDIKLQLAGIDAMGGRKVSARSLEWVLSKIGCVKTDMVEDPAEEEQRTKFNRLEKSRKAFEDEADNDDWLN